MSIQYRIEYFSNDCQCWFDDESDKSFSSFDIALGHLKHCANTEPDMAHRLIKTETIALTVRGETLITGA